MGNRGQRNGGCFGAGDRPATRPTRSLGDLKAFLGEARLPDATRTVDDKSVTPLIFKNVGERGKFGTASDQRPTLGDRSLVHHPTPAAILRDPTRPLPMARLAYRLGTKADTDRAAAERA